MFNAEDYTVLIIAWFVCGILGIFAMAATAIMMDTRHPKRMAIFGAVCLVANCVLAYFLGAMIEDEIGKLFAWLAFGSGSIILFFLIGPELFFALFLDKRETNVPS